MRSPAKPVAELHQNMLLAPLSYFKILKFGHKIVYVRQFAPRT